jgi:diguanylate cyclase (GGDEF)-like protein/PAS domain S-box-containing protein
MPSLTDQMTMGMPAQHRRWPTALWVGLVAIGFALALLSSRHVSLLPAGLAVLGAALLCLAYSHRQQTRVLHEHHSAAQLWQSWLDGSGDAVTVLSLRHDGMGRPMGYTVTHANAKAKALFAHQAQSLVGLSLLELFPDGLHEGFHQHLRRACEQGLPQADEHMVRQWRSDGSTEQRWLHHQIIPCSQGLTLVSRDTTEMHQSIHALREQETFYRTLVDCLPMPVFARSARTGNAGQYVVWNQATEAVMQMPAQQVLGKQPSEVLTQAVAQRSDEMDRLVTQDPRVHHFPKLIYPSPMGEREVDMIKVPVYGVDGQLDHILSIAQDVTEQRQAAEQLRLASRVIEETGDAVVVSDALDRVVMVNPSFSLLSGLSPSEALGRSAELLGLPPLREAHLPGIEHALKQGQRWAGESHQVCPQGRTLDTWMSVSALRNEAKRITQHIRVFSDISALKAQQRELAEQARHDSLTGLPNRRAFGERLTQAMARARRHPQTLALLYVDLDGFKAVNDRHGHAAGDRLLADVAKRLLKCVRLTDCVCRLAGDEFTVILESAGQPGEVDRICQRIVEQVSVPHLIGMRNEVVSPSVGVAVFEAHDTADSLCQRADGAMYEAKRAGKGRFVVAAPFAGKNEKTPPAREGMN